MKHFVFRKTIAIAVATVTLLVGAPCHAVDYLDKQVRALQASGDAEDCFYFMLVGVNQPGPNHGPWFAMSRTQYGAKEAYAMLLAAKLSGERVSVASTTIGCGGYAMANAVWIGQ